MSESLGRGGRSAVRENTPEDVVRMTQTLVVTTAMIYCAVESDDILFSVIQ